MGRANRRIFALCTLVANGLQLKYVRRQRVRNSEFNVCSSELSNGQFTIRKDHRGQKDGRISRKADFRCRPAPPLASSAKDAKAQRKENKTAKAAKERKNNQTTDKISRKLLIRVERGIDRPDFLSGRLSMSGGLDQVPDRSEPERRHVMINGLILSVLDHIGLVVDANIATVADTPAKASPCR
jgi:hypothetical protein